MSPLEPLFVACALAPAALMSLVAIVCTLRNADDARCWKLLLAAGALALATTLATLLLHAFGQAPDSLLPGLTGSVFAAWVALLVQALGTVIGAFSARYLDGERGQRRFVATLAAILAAVHVLLLADHWLFLIAAWTLTGSALQRLLCFYPERAFALLAAHKKRIADRAADLLLIVAAVATYAETGSGSLSGLLDHVAAHGMSVTLEVGAVCMVLAVIVRTAALPVHGWLIQVMEAPTPVSALLHAGVVNLGGFVLIRMSGLLDASALASGLLVAFGLGTALLAGFVMLTRVSVKVRLAWSTVAQMGFMLLECGLGLYQLAALHLIGHSLYKAHAFLAASSVVRDTRRAMLHTDAAPSPATLCVAPLLAFAAVVLVQAAAGSTPWPWWWSAILALAWAPMLWLPAQGGAPAARALAAFAMIAGLTTAALLGHLLPLGVGTVAREGAGVVAMAALAMMYAALAVLQTRPRAWAAWRRWSYAGFYVDETYTRLTLRLWPTRWTPAGARAAWPRPSVDPVQ
ncbi:MAG: NADH-quinone oxidoreductase subunit L [Pseudazoarcus pumilus]|mgnify:CR=1 FL=1|nr:NADH-quinone oxidoreductase subunit L [Pseudazoarcus pumilus]